MSRNRNGKSTLGKYANNQFEFVNVVIDFEEQARAKLWLADRDFDLVGHLSAIADLNCKLSLGLNSWTGHYTAAISSKDDNKPIFKKALVYEHSNIERLIGIAHYILVEMYDSGDSLLAAATEEIDW